MENKNIQKEGDMSGVRFSSWLHLISRSQRTEEGMAVPCGECKACCTSSYFIHIRPDETQTLAKIPKALLFKAPGLPKGNVLMGYDEKGHCPMFIDNQCSIYEHRPLTCRNYDCRIFPATGLQAEDNKTPISRQANRLRFDFPTVEDKTLLSAVQAAAKFIRKHSGRFPDGFIPKNTTQQAVLAIKVYQVFINTPQSRYMTEITRIVEAVMSAYEQFEKGDTA